MSEIVTMTRAEHEALLDRIEELEDLMKVKAVEAAVAAGETEYLPAEMLDRLLAGENPIKVWREHRRMKVVELAKAADIPPPYLSQLESGIRAGSVETLRRIAKALRVTLDDLVPVEM